MTIRNLNSTSCLKINRKHQDEHPSRGVDLQHSLYLVYLLSSLLLVLQTGEMASGRTLNSQLGNNRPHFSMGSDRDKSHILSFLPVSVVRCKKALNNHHSVE